MASGKVCAAQVDRLLAANRTPRSNLPPDALLRMRGEVVHLRINESGRVHVRVTYDVEGLLPTPRCFVFPETAWFPLRRFRTRWNDVTLPIRALTPPADHNFYLAGIYCPRLLLFELPATSGSIHRLENTYDYQAPRFTPGKDENYQGKSGIYVEYILQTGALWKDDIGSVRVEVDTGRFDCRRLRALPGGYEGRCVSRQRWVFAKNNLEPDRDIRLVMED